ncbi:hypothetical protein Taro_037344 [Colocasia esculenta]|uniref:Uncharacterized protein n=1 Tax=Colocasia esculenta TaxID=4460 RepID=A0A843WFZ8_COLES|nr:hypothetical protein [Colocasia esculenta]
MTNPEIATGAYEDSDRAVRPGVRSRQATGAVRPGVRLRQATTRIATGRDQKATGCCEERDWAVRSSSTVATERFTAIRSRRCWLSQQDLRTRPIGPSRSQGLRLILTEQGHVLRLRSKTAIYGHRVLPK